MRNLLFALLALLLGSAITTTAQSGKYARFAEALPPVESYNIVWEYGDQEGQYLLQIRSGEQVGVRAYCFRLSPTQWLLVRTDSEKAKGGIYEFLVDPEAEERADDWSNKPQNSKMKKLRDWPLEQDQPKEADAFVYPEVPNQSLQHYYVDGRLIATVYYKRQKPKDPIYYSYFIHRKDHYLLPIHFFVRTGKDFLNLRMDVFSNSIQQGTLLPSPIVGQPQKQALLPDGFWEGWLKLDESWYKEAPDYRVAKGFFKKGARNGWTLLHTGETEQTWLAYFKNHQVVASFEGEFDSFTDAKGREHTPAAIAKVDEEKGAVTSVAYDDYLNDYFVGSWAMGEQQIPNPFDYAEPRLLLWEKEGVLAETLKSDTEAFLELKADGSFRYQLAGQKKATKGSWELEIQPVPEREYGPHDGMYVPLDLKLRWDNGQQQAYRLQTLFDGLAIVGKVE